MRPQPAGVSISTFPFSAERIIQRYLKPRLALFETGSVTLEFPNGAVMHHSGSRPGADAVVSVCKWRFLRKLLLEGEIGLARGFVDGDWSTPDLDAVLEFGLQNVSTVSVATTGFGAAHTVNRWVHGRNANTRRGSQRNIAAHYDLGNEFYRHWLDPEMNYSSAIFAGEHDTLEDAQARKAERIVELLDLEGGEEILEIGCGWGALARRMVRAGAESVTGISLSREQIDHARASVAGSTIEDQIHFELRDYRNVIEQYDRIVSIEMIEAVGERYWPVYFDRLRQSLKSDGCAVLQVITISDDLFDSYRRRPDFIQKYIFPGGMLPTVDIVKKQAANVGFRVDHHQAFGSSYAQTLDAWHDRFVKAWPEIEKLGFDDRFFRMWSYYLRYCATGFRHQSIDVGLFKFSPDGR